MPSSVELVDAYGGVNMVVVHYRSIGRKVVAEVLEVDDEMMIVRGSATHGDSA